MAQADAPAAVTAKATGVTGGAGAQHTEQAQFSTSRTQRVNPQPAPGVIDTASHKTTHVLPRRFLGPMPENVTNSTENELKRQKFRHLRKEAVSRIRDLDGSRRSSLGGFGEVDEGPSNRIGQVVRKIRVRRRGSEGEEVEEDIDLDSAAEDSDDSGSGLGLIHRKSKKKKKRKDVWTGESFDIGREFLTSSRRSVRGDSPEARSTVSAGAEIGSNTSTKTSKRPLYTPRSTQDSFVTARTQFEDADSSTTSVHHIPDPDAQAGPSTSAQSFVTELRPQHSQSSSVRPLLGYKVDEDEEEITSTVSPKDMDLHEGRGAGRASPISLKRLRSAMRKGPRYGSTQSTMSAAKGRRRVDGSEFRSKSVQFPVEPARFINEQSSREGETSRNGAKSPVDPTEVLAREGDDAQGTSAGAVEAAMEDEDDEDYEDDYIVPGTVALRDRMLVRVGYHRDPGLSNFDELAQRRNPCSRLEQMEEYIVVWRKGRVELYQDWTNPIQERLKGHKRLCFIIPLSPTQSSLCIFNETDMSLCLTTAASKLRTFDNNTRTATTRSQALRNRVKDSKQAQWLRTGRRGTHVFILKIAERSRALDWYWELWRELGGELPKRFDISVPSLSTSIRLQVPEDEDMVGGRQVLRKLNTRKIVDTCWSMLSETIDIEDLMRQRQRSKGADELDLELAWKGVDGNVEWIAHPTTVTGKPRDWAVLAGVAKNSVERQPRTLQLRAAHHQPCAIKLEDGTSLEEPPGVEGYLVRHKSAAAPKEQVFISTHDGNIFTSTSTLAKPPVKAGKEGSTPGDLFPELHKAFYESEHKRMAHFIETSAGCFDLRNIVSAKLSTADEDEHSSGKGNDPKSVKSFDVVIATGGTVTFEADSRPVAKEWVERLTALSTYWKRRHRVDARLRMDAMELHGRNDPFAGTQLSNDSDDILSDVWDWCVIKGCRSVCLSGRLFMKKGPSEKFRAKYLVLSGGCFVSFKVKRKSAFYPKKNHYPLFGAYVYSGRLALDELHEAVRENALGAQARVYQDGLQSTDGAEDTVFCVRLAIAPHKFGARRTNPWDLEPDIDFLPPPLTKSPARLLIFKARSKLERDRWVWAINAEMERQVRSHVSQENAWREWGKVPE